MITLQLEPYDGFLTNLDENGNIISFNSDISLLQRKDIVEMLPNSLDALFDSNAILIKLSDISLAFSG